MLSTIRCLGFVLLVGLFLWEVIIDHREQKQLYHQKETRHNLILGAMLLLFSSATKAFTFLMYELAYQMRLYSISMDVAVFCFLLLLSDLCYYLYHRTAHHRAWFWASHCVHHSAEKFNISVAFRQSLTKQVSGEFLFWTWLCWIGFEPLSVFLCYQLCHIYQTWLHTELIGKLPPFVEFLFNTPSHHRVHHASNEEYLDKNFGGILIIWDRLFGTYQEERAKPVYGLSSRQQGELSSVLWQEWKVLLQHLKNAKSIRRIFQCLLHSPKWDAKKELSNKHQVLLPSVKTALAT